MRVAIAVLCLVACGKGDSKKPDTDPKGAGGTAAAGATFDKLELLVDGKPVPMKRAFIKRVSPDQWRMLVADDEGSCEELLSGVTNRKPGATSFVATAAKRVKPDGTELVTVLDLWSGGHLADAVLASATIEGSTDKGNKVQVELGKMIDATKQRKLEIKGSFTAEGCGDQPVPTVGLPKAKHPSAATITVAGKPLPLQGAIRRGDEIALTTGLRDCSPPTTAAQINLEHRDGKWTLSGTWLGDASETPDGDPTKGLVVSAGSAGTSGVDGATINLTLSGEGKIGDYPVSLAGTIEAIDCKH